MFSANSVATSIVVGLILFLGIAVPAVLCSLIGARKGYNSLIFLLLGLLASVAGLIVAVVLPSRHEQVNIGTIARMHQQVTLADGRHLPRGLIGRIHDLRVDTTGSSPIVICEIEDPLGERHWVARSVLVPA